MLSPHELTTLMLVNGGHDQPQLDCAELDSLRRQQLITLHQPGTDFQQARMTDRGARLLDAVVRMR